MNSIIVRELPGGLRVGEFVDDVRPPIRGGYNAVVRSSRYHRWKMGTLLSGIGVMHAIGKHKRIATVGTPFCRARLPLTS